MAKQLTPTQEKRARMKQEVAQQKKEYKAYLKESEKELRQKEKEIDKLEQKQYMTSKLDPLWHFFMLLLIAGVWVFIFWVLIKFGILELPNGI